MVCRKTFKELTLEGTIHNFQLRDFTLAVRPTLALSNGCFFELVADISLKIDNHPMLERWRWLALF